jgi:hypothetical protein
VQATNERAEYGLWYQLHRPLGRSLPFIHNRVRRGVGLPHRRLSIVNYNMLPRSIIGEPYNLGHSLGELRESRAS